MKLKNVLNNALEAILSSYEGKKFVPSLIIKLVIALVSGIVTAVFADTLFSVNTVVNQVFAAVFFWFILIGASKIISGIKGRYFVSGAKNAFCGMLRPSPSALCFFIGAAAAGLLLPYPLVFALAFFLFVSAASGENSLILSIKRAISKKESNGRGLCASVSGLLVCATVICVLSCFNIPGIYNIIDKNLHRKDSALSPAPTMPSTTLSVPEATKSIQPTATVPANLLPDNPTEDEIKAAAKKLINRLINTAGKDEAEFKTLFRNTSDEVIDKYYRQSYEKLKSLDNSLIAIAAGDEYYVWITALYYTIPENYPSEKEASAYFSTILSLKDNELKIEYTDESVSRLKPDFDNASFTNWGYQAKENGYAWAKFFIPFRPFYEVLLYENAIMCKIPEIYMDGDGNVNITVYVSNGYKSAATFNGISELTVSDGGNILFSIKDTDAQYTLDAGGALTYTVTVPKESINFTSWTAPKIETLDFSFEKGK